MDGLYFYMQKGSEPLIEIYAPENVTILYGNASTVRTDKKYIGRLKYTFADAPELAGEVDKVTPDRKSMINISKKYHDQLCKDEQCIVYEKKLHIAKISIGPIIGFTSQSIIPEEITFLNPSGSNDTYYCTFDPSNNLCFGIFCNISLPTEKDRLKLQYEGLIKTNSFSSQYYAKSQSSSVEYNFSLQSTDLSHYFFLRYDFLKTRFHSLVQIGGFINQKLKLERTGFDPDTYLVDIFPKDAYPGLSIGLGVAYQINEKKEATLKATYNRGYGSFIYLNAQEINVTLTIPIFQFKLD